MSIKEEDITWKDIEIGAIVTNPGNTVEYKTGDWRSQAPTYTYSRCIKCGMCQMFCPEGCIEQNEEGYFVANLFWCKGCGICSRECPTGVITMVEESE
ncbi:MAG TPA: 4Fe-4S binding protein [Dehalococcoidia bacterium]|nr:4Fe-4S binding protein [Dehalococcoidia bacterium]